MESKTNVAEAGPELPPGFDDQFNEMPPSDTAEGQKSLFVDNKEQSELKNSISRKGGNSYYYAHNYSGQNFNDELAKKVYGDGIIHGGEPVLVATNESKKETV